MKWNIIKADFNKTTGISTVTIATDKGLFEGTSRLHEEDNDIVSNFQGCKYAEARAGIKYIKKINEDLDISINTLKKYLKNISQLRCYDEDRKEIRLLKKEIERLENKKLNNLKIIGNAKEGLYNSMKSYRDMHNKFFTKIGKKEQEPTEK